MRRCVVPLLLAALTFGGCEEKGEQLRLRRFGPDETGYPLAVVEGGMKDLTNLRVRGTDGSDTVVFTVDAAPGSTVLYTLPRGLDDDDESLRGLARVCAERIQKRLRAAGHFDVAVRPGRAGEIIALIPEKSIDGGAEIAGAFHDGTVVLRLEVQPDLAWKKAEVKRWRAARRAGQRYTPSEATRRVVLETGRDGTQTYHFKAVRVDPEGKDPDRGWFERFSVSAPTSERQVLHIHVRKDARAKLAAWFRKPRDGAVALLIHGAYYGELTKFDSAAVRLEVPVRSWPARPAWVWAQRLCETLWGDPLPASPRLRVRVDIETSPTGRFEIHAPMAHEGALTLRVDVPGAKDVAPVERTRRHVPGHFVKYYFIIKSYLGGRLTGVRAAELGAYDKYMESPLLSFMVGITLSHYDFAPMNILAARILGEWRGEFGQLMMRFKQGLALRDRPEVRWAAVEGLRLRVEQGELDPSRAADLCAPLLNDDNERVRVAAACARSAFEKAGEADTAVLQAAKTSKDSWVRWAVTR